MINSRQPDVLVGADILVQFEMIGYGVINRLIEHDDMDEFRILELDVLPSSRVAVVVAIDLKLQILCRRAGPDHPIGELLKRELCLCRVRINVSGASARRRSVERSAIDLKVRNVWIIRSTWGIGTNRVCGREAAVKSRHLGAAEVGADLFKMRNEIFKALRLRQRLIGDVAGIIHNAKCDRGLRDYDAGALRIVDD